MVLLPLRLRGLNVETCYREYLPADCLSEHHGTDYTAQPTPAIFQRNFIPADGMNGQINYIILFQ